MVLKEATGTALPLL